MKFLNKSNGAIIEPKSEIVAAQLMKSPDYAPYEPQEAADAAEKSLAKMNKAELLEAAQAAGIAVPDGATKAEIVELIQAQDKDQGEDQDRDQAGE